MASINVPSPCPITITSATFVHPTCNGGTTGSITVNVSGGPLPAHTYSYFLNTATTGVIDGPSHTFTGLAAGVYVVDVLPIGGIPADVGQGCAATADVTLVAPGALAPAVLSQSQPTCNGGINGGVTIGVTAALHLYGNNSRYRISSANRSRTIYFRWHNSYAITSW